MADYCCQYDIAGIQINDATDGADRLLTDLEGGEISGLDGAPIRAQIDPRGQISGGIVHPKLFGARIITFTGAADIQSVAEASTTAWITALNVLEAAVIVALEGILNTPSSLAWTPTGGAAKSITVTYGTEGGEIRFSGPMLPGERKFTFTLVAESPTIS